MHTQPQLSFHDPSLPPVPPLPAWLAVYCTCEQPVPEERAAPRGAGRAHCARCDRELPLRPGER